jgi:hypothetical protein
VGVAREQQGKGSHAGVARKDLILGEESWWGPRHSFPIFRIHAGEPPETT